jgi:leucine dehydrogenase
MRGRELMSQLFDLNMDLFSYAETQQLQELHIKVDPETGLRAIIAIHNTNLGPSLGGCRCVEYPDVGSAFYDAIRLAEGMSYKAAIMNLPLGGGKSVLLKPKEIKDRKAYFKAFGRFVQALNGRYITAEDSGTTAQDMDAIFEETSYVTGLSKGTLDPNSSDDPSPYTALGTFLGIEATVAQQFGHKDFSKLHVAIQGVGSVGFKVAKHLHERGARLSVTDTNQAQLERCKTEFNATIVPTDQIHAVDCDVYAPCAYGAIINHRSIPEIKAKVIAGCANNQLETPAHGKILQEKGILYAPDYVINAGGLIFVCHVHYRTFSKIEEDVRHIPQVLRNIYERSAQTGDAPNFIADEIAKARLYAKN